MLLAPLRTWYFTTENERNGDIRWKLNIQYIYILYVYIYTVCIYIYCMYIFIYIYIQVDGVLWPVGRWSGKVLKNQQHESQKFAPARCRAFVRERQSVGETQCRGWFLFGEVFIVSTSMWLTVRLSIRCPKTKLDPLVVGNPLFVSSKMAILCLVLDFQGIH